MLKCLTASNPEHTGVHSSYFILFFWLCHMACRILVPGSGIRPGPLTTGLLEKPLQLVLDSGNLLNS